MFMSVDLPAPFSPRSACTSPRRTSRSTSSLATVPGNSLRMPRISRTSSSVISAILTSGTEGAGTGPAPSRCASRIYWMAVGTLSLPLMMFAL